MTNLSGNPRFHDLPRIDMTPRATKPSWVYIARKVAGWILLAAVLISPVMVQL